MLSPFHKIGADQEFYFLGKIKRNDENWSSIAKRIGTFKRVIPVFVIYDRKRVLEGEGEDNKVDHPLDFYKKGRIVIPRSRLVEGFTLAGHGYFDADEKYTAIEKETCSNGRIERYTTSTENGRRIPFGASQLSQWDKEVLGLVKQLPDYVLSVIFE